VGRGEGKGPTPGILFPPITQDVSWRQGGGIISLGEKIRKGERGEKNLFLARHPKKKKKKKAKPAL